MLPHFEHSILVVDIVFSLLISLSIIAICSSGPCSIVLGVVAVLEVTSFS